MALVYIIIALLCLLGLIITIPLQKWWKSPMTQKTFSFWRVTRLRLWIVCLFCFVMVSQDRYRKEKRHSYPNAALRDRYEYLYNQALRLPFPVDKEDVDIKGISKKDSEYYYDDIAVMRYYWGGKDVETKKEKGRKYVKSLRYGTWIEVEDFTFLQLGTELLDSVSKIEFYPDGRRYVPFKELKKKAGLDDTLIIPTELYKTIRRSTMSSFLGNTMYVNGSGDVFIFNDNMDESILIVGEEYE